MKLLFECILFFLTFCGFVSPQLYTKSFKKIKIGGIFPEGSDDLVIAFNNAVEFTNRFSEILRFETNIVTVDINDSFKVHKAVCEMISNNDDDTGNVAAIFGPNSPKTAGVVSSICQKLRIPHFTAIWRPIDSDSNINNDNDGPSNTQSENKPYLPIFTQNLFPNSKKYSNAIYEIVKSFQWKKFAIVYDSDDSLVRLQEIFPLSSELQFNKQSMKYYRLPKDSSDFKPLLKDISKSGVNQVMIDCSLENIRSILMQSPAVGMMNEYVKYFIVNHDGYTMDLSAIGDITANITTIRLLNLETIDFNEYPSRGNVYASQMTTEAALLRDAVKIFSMAFGSDETFISDFRINPTSCDGSNSNGDSQSDTDQDTTSSTIDLVNNINRNSVEGLTGLISFENGQRNSFYIEVIEYQHNNDPIDPYKKIAKYKYPWPNPLRKVELLRNFSAGAEEEDMNMQSKIFKVMMRESPPFCMKKKDVGSDPNTNLSVYEKYEGFSMDLIQHIAARCKFRYEIEVTDKEYGKEDPVTKQWTGVVGDIVDKKVDFAIGDITITYARKTAIDFSTPFMTLGISILYAKPHKEKPGLFSFMGPLSKNVWFYMATAFLIISIVEFALAKIATKDWENPHPCDDDPEELENIWNMHNCIWLSVGSIMQQGCDILPKGVPPRLAAVAWWFFALIVISSYTANLAAFLTKENMEQSIQNVEELASQSEIQYGCMTGGSTESFFKNSNYSTYQKMWGFMSKAEPSVFEAGNPQGVERVERSNRMYAFFMESVPIRYETHKNCNLTQVGGLLDSKEYGIAMPANSPYRQQVSLAILRLQEAGVIHNLTEFWWEENITDENGNQVKCEDDTASGDTNELGMDNVGGVFLVLGVGLMIAIFVGILEFFWSVRQTSIEERITPMEALKKEFLFALSVWKLRKPIGAGSETCSFKESIGSEDEKEKAIRLNSVNSIKQNGTGNGSNGYGWKEQTN